MDKYNFIFSNDTISILTEFLNKIMSSEAKIELERIKLNKLKLFNIKNYFDKFCVENNFITRTSFEVYFRNFNISKEEIDLLFNRFDKNKDSIIDYQEVR